MGGRIPIMVGFALIIFSISLVVYWLLTGSIFGFFSSKPATPQPDTPQAVATSMSLSSGTGEQLTTQPQQQPPPVATTSLPTVTATPTPLNVTPKPAAPPPPPPPDVLWSRLNEQIYTLEDARKTLVNTVVERLPEEQKQQLKTEKLPNLTTENTATTLAATTNNTRTTATAKTPEPAPENTILQAVTWQQMTQQMMELEQSRQRLINAVAKQVTALNPDTVPIQPLTFETETQTTTADMPLTAAAETVQPLSALSLSTGSGELLDTYQLRPADTNNLLNSRTSSLGYVFILSDLVFETDQDQLQAGTLYMLDRLAKALNALPQQDILIEGHTDDRGNSDYNLQLSQRRAAAVKQALLTRGVSEARIQARGYGELLPIADNHSEAGRLKNRRVEITLLTTPLTD